MKCVGELSWRYLSGVQIGLDTHLDDFKKHLLPLVKPEWDPNKVCSTVLDGGITNSLFAIFDSETGLERSGHEVVLLRVNGAGTDDIISRTDEVISLLTLHKNDLSPPVHAQLQNGLCYGYLPGSTLAITAIRENVMKMRIAKTMAKLHSLDVPHAFRCREPHAWCITKKCLSVLQHKFDNPGKQKWYAWICLTVSYTVCGVHVCVFLVTDPCLVLDIDDMYAMH